MIIYHQMEEMYYEGKEDHQCSISRCYGALINSMWSGSTQETTAAPAADSKAEETTAAAEGSEAATGEGVDKRSI